MTREEKIEIMFESILSEVERVGTLLEGKGLNKVQSETGALEEKLDELMDRFYNIRIQTPQLDPTPITNSIDQLILELKGMEKEDKNEKNSQNRSQVNFLMKPWAWVVGLILMGSIGINFYLFNKSSGLNTTYRKYQFLYHSGNSEYLDQLDSLWQVDSIRNEYIRFIDSKNFSSENQLRKWK